MATVLCMKWGTAYSADYVNILYRAVSANLEQPFRFICLTDDDSGLDRSIEAYPLPDIGLSPERLAHGGWQKLCVFAPALHQIEGRVLFLDVDIVITGSLDVFFDSQQPLLIIREWAQIGHRLMRRDQVGGNSSVFAFDLGAQAQIYHAFMADPETAFTSFRNEQRFLVTHAQGLAYWPKGLCLSFKADLMHSPPWNFLCRTRALPSNVRIVVFHGRPLPDEVCREGWWGKGLRRGFGKVGWAQNHWLTYSGPPYNAE